MKRCIAPGIGGGQVRTLGYQPPGQVIGALVESQSRLFAVPTASIDFTTIEYGFEFARVLFSSKASKSFGSVFLFALAISLVSWFE